MTNLTLREYLNCLFLFKKRLQRAVPKHYESNYGFTLIEMMITVFMIGILSAIVAPSWLGFVDARRLNTAQDQVYRAMREAQSNAKRNKVRWQASFREETNVYGKLVVQWAVYPVPIESEESIPTNATWNELEPSIRLDAETNLPELGGVRRVSFNYQGCPIYDKGDQCTYTNPRYSLGRITLSSRNGGRTKRCVIVSTLLGAMRTGKEHPTAKNGRYCY